MLSIARISGARSKKSFAAAVRSSSRTRASGSSSNAASAGSRTYGASGMARPNSPSRYANATLPSGSSMSSISKFDMAAMHAFANRPCFRVSRATAASVSATTYPAPWCMNCKRRSTMGPAASPSPSRATRATPRTASRAIPGSTSETYSESSVTISYVFPTSATATSASILSRFTAGGSPTRQKKDLYSLAKRGGARSVNRCRCAQTAYAGSWLSVCASVSSGAFMRSNTCWCTSGSSSVARRKHFTVASTTAELLCCSRSSSAFITSKVSVLSAGGYSAIISRIVTCAHSVKSFRRLISPYTICFVAKLFGPSISISVTRQLNTAAAF